MSYHLSLRWDRRREPIESCAMRFARMLERWAEIHPNLADWHRKARTKTAAYRAFCTMPPCVDELEEILNRGRSFKSVSKELVPESGFSAHAWNGRNKPEGLSLSVQVGNYYHSRLDPNEIWIQGLRQENSLADATLLKRVMVATAESWDAEWGAVQDWAYDGLTHGKDGNPLLPLGGWLTYLSPAYAAQVTSPTDVRSERLADGGLIMTVSDEPLDVNNPVHAARLGAVQKALAPVQRPLSLAFYSNPPPPRT